MNTVASVGLKGPLLENLECFLGNVFGCASLGVASVLSVSGYLWRVCVLGACLVHVHVHVRAHTWRFTSLPSSLLPGNMSGVCSHRSPHSSLGHGVLCPLIGKFPGVGPRLLAVLWSLEREWCSGDFVMNPPWELGSLPLPLTGT